MKIHYIYKTTSPSGKYYIGRHTTENIDDGYIGSGKLIRSIKDKSKLQKEILCFCDENSIFDIERKFIVENIDNTNCMNFNDSPVGFATGLRNPSFLPHVRAKSKERFQNNNPGKYQTRESIERGKITRSLNEEWKNKGIENMRALGKSMKGKPKTEEQKRKNSEWHKGKKQSRETIEKRIESRRQNGRPWYTKK